MRTSKEDKLKADGVDWCVMKIKTAADGMADLVARYFHISFDQSKLGMGAGLASR